MFCFQWKRVHKKNLVCLAVFLLFFVFVKDNAMSGSVTIDAPFYVDGQSMWSSGSAFYYSKNDFIGSSWDNKLSVGSSEFGVQLTGNTTGKIGLEYDFTISSGSVSVNYPIQSTINHTLQ